MILIISVCKEKLHYYEFVKPIGEILSEQNWKIKHYTRVKDEDINNADKIIICGTSLKDNNFTKHLNKFSWIKEIDKPILGICAGMQIIALTYKAKLSKKTEIGFYKENFKENFLGMNGEQEVYHLHRNYTSTPKEFSSFTKSKIPQAIKHKTRHIYGVLFHPEVRNKKLIENFANL